MSELPLLLAQRFKGYGRRGWSVRYPYRTWVIRTKLRGREAYAYQAQDVS